MSATAPAANSAGAAGDRYNRRMRHALRIAVAVALLAVLGAAPRAQPAPATQDATPATLAEFRAAAERVLKETGIPGAGIALVRQDGIEWAGGIGWADRDERVAASADTHFRAGSISKTFVALALVQLQEDGLLDLDASVSEIAPEIPIDNPWAAEAPVLVRHLLEHTAGLDDMHFRQVYNNEDAADLPLLEGLRRSPAALRVRWKPGTRAAYSNVGYTAAAVVLEKVAQQPFEEYIEEQVFVPLQMATSSFVLTAEHEALLARGYESPGTPPVQARQIYLRPAGNLHTSAAELGRFVQMLLNWGELDEEPVVDPEYLGNMEFPRTSLAARAGVRTGYGLGLYHHRRLPYPVLGHDGGIDGFISTFGYSPSRDVGFVVLINGSWAPAALDRLASLAIRYLKRDVESPAPPTATAGRDDLVQLEGYYQPANPRHQVAAFLDFLTAGFRVRIEDGRLVTDPAFGPPTPLIPAGHGLFRREGEVVPTIAFATDETGRLVMTGSFLYAEQRPAWAHDLLRGALAAAAALALSVFIALPVWLLLAAVRYGDPREWWGLRATLAGASVALVTTPLALWTAPLPLWGERNGFTALAFAGWACVPVLVVLGAGLVVLAWRRGAGRALVAYAAAVVVAQGVLAGYLAWWGMLGLRTWAW
jgi:CubicO group peptidase (beta-lactamase class C family)